MSERSARQAQRPQPSQAASNVVRSKDLIMLDVTIEYDDKFTESTQDRFSDLYKACIYAFELADKRGNDDDNDHGLPRWVHIIQEGRKELSISIVRGGLFGS